MVGTSSMLVWFAPTGADQPPRQDPGQPGISRSLSGFSVWMEHSVVAIDRAVPEIRWCYFGVSSNLRDTDIGRIDRLAVGEGIALSFVLPEPNPGPAIVEGTTTVVLVHSPIALAAGSTVMIRLLVEEGQRFIDPDGPNVVAEVSTPARLVLQYTLTGDGNTLDHALVLPTRDDNRPEQGGNIRLTLAAPQAGARYRLGTPSSGYLIAIRANRLQIMDYCAALNMRVELCARLSSISFANGSAEERSWNARYPAGAVPGDSLSVASPGIGAGDYSCLSLHFSDPLVAGSDISFQWSVGRGAGGDANSSSTLLVWLAPTGADQPPMIDPGQPSISQAQAGFSDWMGYSAMAVDRVVPEIRWCYFGADPSPGEMDVGRIDRLEAVEGVGIRFVLPEPNPGPGVVEGMAAAIIVRSEVPVEAGRTVEVRLLAEGGQRFLDPNGPNVVAEVSTAGRLVLELPLTGDGSTLEHALMLPTRDDNRPESGDNIRLALADPPPGAGYRVSTPNSGYLIAIQDNRRQITEYCDALNLVVDLCARVSSVIFTENGSGERAWDASHRAAARPGDRQSVASPMVGDSGYSCLSLHFSEPIVAGSDISFQWALGRGSSGGASRLQVWFAPTADDQPPMSDPGQPGITQNRSGFSDWMEYSAMAIDRAVPEIRWCYFGTPFSATRSDFGRIDQLAVSEGIAFRFVLPGPAVFEGTAAAIVVGSVVALEAGRSVMIRLLVEEGNRFLDPNGPNVVAEVSTPGRLVLEYPLIGDGNTLKHALILPIRDDNLPEPGGNIRLALVEPLPDVGYRLGTPSSGYLIAVIDDDSRPDAEELIRWWRLLRQCEESGSGCPARGGSTPTLTNSPGLASAERGMSSGILQQFFRF